jgi:hypothetical protein
MYPWGYAGEKNREKAKCDKLLIILDLGVRQYQKVENS